MKILNLGCGISRLQYDGTVFPEGTVHVDRNTAVNPDVLWDCDAGLPHSVEENSIDEIHAYHLIEHVGTLGDTTVWFNFWRSCWKALKPLGIMWVVAPFYLHEDAWGDPTHVRPICKQTFLFLNRKAYDKKPGTPGSAMSQLGIDFDLPVEDLKLQVIPGESIPCSLLVKLSARKTADGGLVPLEGMGAPKAEPEAVAP